MNREEAKSARGGMDMGKGSFIASTVRFFFSSSTHSNSPSPLHAAPHSLRVHYPTNEERTRIFTFSGIFNKMGNGLPTSPPVEF